MKHGILPWTRVCKEQFQKYIDKWKIKGIGSTGEKLHKRQLNSSDLYIKESQVRPQRSARWDEIEGKREALVGGAFLGGGA